MQVRPSLVLATAAYLLLSACGDGTSATSGTTMAPPPDPEINGIEIVGDAAQQIDAFVAHNALAQERVKTASGLEYVIEVPGGEEKPSLSSDITIYYHGYLVDGKTFDRTKGEPRTFPLSGLIPAWQEAIPLIGKGGTIKIFAPPSTAYGSRPPAGTGITENTVLVFDITLVDFEG